MLTLSRDVRVGLYRFSTNAKEIVYGLKHNIDLEDAILVTIYQFDNIQTLTITNSNNSLTRC